MRLSKLKAVLVMVGATLQWSCGALGLCDEERSLSFEASLTPAAVVPPVTDAAVGHAEVSLREARGSGSFRVLFVTVRGRAQGTTEQTIEPHHVVGIHIHEGDSGINGPVLRGVPLEPRGGGTLTQASFDGGVELFDLMETRVTYLDVHTMQFPDGQVRGSLDRISGNPSWHCPSPN